MSRPDLPDDESGWEKKGIREHIGTSEEHVDDLFVHGDYAVERDADGTYEAYVIVGGTPIKVNGGMTTFREAVEFLRGSLASKELVDDHECKEKGPVEPEHPKSDNMEKGRRPMSSMRAMMAETHGMENWQEIVRQDEMRKAEIVKSTTHPYNPPGAGRNIHPNVSPRSSAERQPEISKDVPWMTTPENMAKQHTVYGEPPKPYGLIMDEKTGKIDPRSHTTPPQPYIAYDYNPNQRSGYYGERKVTQSTPPTELDRNLEHDVVGSTKERREHEKTLKQFEDAKTQAKSALDSKDPMLDRPANEIADAYLETSAKLGAEEAESQRDKAEKDAANEKKARSENAKQYDSKVEERNTKPKTKKTIVVDQKRVENIDGKPGIPVDSVSNNPINAGRNDGNILDGRNTGEKTKVKDAIIAAETPGSSAQTIDITDVEGNPVYTKGKDGSIEQFVDPKTGVPIVTAMTPWGNNLTEHLYRPYMSEERDGERLTAIEQFNKMIRDAQLPEALEMSLDRISAADLNDLYSHNFGFNTGLNEEVGGNSFTYQRPNNIMNIPFLYSYDPTKPFVDKKGRISLGNWTARRTDKQIKNRKGQTWDDGEYSLLDLLQLDPEEVQDFVDRGVLDDPSSKLYEKMKQAVNLAGTSLMDGEESPEELAEEIQNYELYKKTNGEKGAPLSEGRRARIEQYLYYKDILDGIKARNGMGDNHKEFWEEARGIGRNANGFFNIENPFARGGFPLDPNDPNSVFVGEGRQYRRPVGDDPAKFVRERYALWNGLIEQATNEYTLARKKLQAATKGGDETEIAEAKLEEKAAKAKMLQMRRYGLADMKNAYGLDVSLQQQEEFRKMAEADPEANSDLIWMNPDFYTQSPSQYWKGKRPVEISSDEGHWDSKEKTGTDWDTEAGREYMSDLARSFLKNLSTLEFPEDVYNSLRGKKGEYVPPKRISNFLNKNRDMGIAEKLAEGTGLDLHDKEDYQILVRSLYNAIMGGYLAPGADLKSTVDSSDDLSERKYSKGKYYLSPNVNYGNLTEGQIRGLFTDFPEAPPKPIDTLGKKQYQNPMMDEESQTLYRSDKMEKEQHLGGMSFSELLKARMDEAHADDGQRGFCVSGVQGWRIVNLHPDGTEPTWPVVVKDAESGKEFVTASNNAYND